mmetsp:Transcript_67599/g.207053  ORF Transcript_67599/g.207053 Transcript_67599/m.207053 type:complete len:261 (-) Transcript_67599:1742-2524(-)
MRHDRSVEQILHDCHVVLRDEVILGVSSGLERVRHVHGFAALAEHFDASGEQLVVVLRTMADGEGVGFDLTKKTAQFLAIWLVADPRPCGPVAGFDQPLGYIAVVFDLLIALRIHQFDEVLLHLIQRYVRLQALPLLIQACVHEKPALLPVLGDVREPHKALLDQLPHRTSHLAIHAPGLCDAGEQEFHWLFHAFLGRRAAAPGRVRSCLAVTRLTILAQFTVRIGLRLLRRKFAQMLHFARDWINILAHVLNGHVLVVS